MRLRICSLGGTDVLLHSAILPVAAYMILCGQGAMFVTAMLSIILHEAAHALAAAWLGARPDTVEITPLGAVMRVEDDARLTAGRRFVMLAAGPAATLGLCTLSLAASAGRMIPLDAGRMIFRANAGLMMINLLPCLPLDGGRILSLLLEQLAGTVRAQRAMRWLSTGIGIGCMGVAAVITWRTGGLQFSLAACGCVILYAAHTSTESTAMAELRQWMARKIRLEQRGYLPVRPMAVMDTLPLRKLMTRLPQRGYAEILLFEAGSMRLLARRTEGDLVTAYLDAPGASCGALAKECVR